MRIRKLLCTLLAVSLLSASVDTAAFASESAQTQESQEQTESAVESQEQESMEEMSEKESSTDTLTEEENDSGEKGESSTPEESAANESSSDLKEETAIGETEENTTSEESETSGEITTDEETETETEIETETEAEVSFLGDDLSIEAANGLGNLLMDDLQIAAREGQSEAQADYGIAEIEVSSSTAEVSLHASGVCTVVVSIYEENSIKPVAFGSALVEVGEARVRVPLETDAMPEYFVIKGHIVDTDSLRPLSTEYESSMYTQAMREFLKKTTDDFDAEKVLNLDDDKKTNFIVVNDTNTLIQQFQDENNKIVNEFIDYKEETRTYTFRNVDNSISDLKKGDIFVYQYGDNDIFIIKVGDIQIEETQDNGTVVVITATEDELNVEDVFSYIKIEEIAGNAEADEIDPESCPEGVTYLGRGRAVGYAVEGEPSLSYTPDMFSLDLDKARKGNIGFAEGEVEGEIEASISFEVEVKYYFDLHPIDLEKASLWYVDIGFSSTIGVEGTLEIDGKLSVPLCPAVEIKTKILTATYVPTFVIGMSFEGTFEMSITGTRGWRFGNMLENGDYQNNEVTLFELSAELEGYVGIDFSPKLKVIKILDAELEVGIHCGVEGAISNDDSDHECGLLCVSGDFFFEIPFDGKLKILKLKEIDFNDELEVEGSLLKVTFGEFYYSIKHKQFGWGECPYINANAEVTIMVLDSAGNPVEGATVSTYKHAYAGQTNADGMVSITVSEGNQSFFATYIDTEENCPKTGSITYDVKEGERTKLLIFLDSMKATLPTSQKVADLCCSDYPSEYWMARMEDGSLYTWGDNSTGLLGNGSVSESEPESTSFISTPVKVLDQVKDMAVDNMDSSFRCAAAVTNDGRLYMWGSNSNGQLGIGKTADELPNVTVPTQVLIPEKIEKVTIGYQAVAAITEKNELYMWGYDHSGRLGTDDLDDSGNHINIDLNEPKLIMNKVADVSISQSNTMVLTIDGNVYTWGSDHCNLLGDDGSASGSSDYRYQPELEHPILTNVKTIALSTETAAAVTKDGSLYMWGRNDCGQLGIGSTRYSNGKAQVTGLSNVEKVELFNGYYSAAITTSGDLYMWGRNEHGQLGDGSNENRTSPYKIENLHDVLDVKGFDNNSTKGISMTIAITEKHEMWQWGSYNAAIERKIKNANRFVNNSTYYYIAMADGSLWQYYVPITSGRLRFIPVLDSNNALQSDCFEDIAANTETTTYTLSEYNSPKTFEGLVPGELYNFYAMKSRTSSTPLESYNLLSIAQGKADKDGKMTIDFELREDYGTPDLFIVGQTQINLNDSLDKIEITNVDDLFYNGSDQYITPVVNYGGRKLTEGTDYYLSGDYKAKDVGIYTVIIVGTGLYRGVIALDYYVKQITYTVTFDSDGGTPVESQNVENGMYATKPDSPIKEGFRFISWYWDGIVYDFTTTKVSQDITLTAHWEELKPVTVPTSSIQSGSTINIGTKIMLQCQTSDAVIYFTTDGTDPTQESPVYQEPIIITVDTTIKAFAAKEGWLDSEIVSFVYTVYGYLITFDSDGGSSVMSQRVEEGKTVTEPDAPVKEGYRFAGWYLDGEPYDFAEKVTKDIILKAQWEEIPVVSAPVSNIPSGRTVLSGTGIILTCAEQDAVIYYTTDESIPTSQNEKYQKPIALTEDTVIKAFASKEGFRDSEMVSFSYKVSGKQTDGSDDYDSVLPDDIPDSGIPEGLWIAGVQKSYPYTGLAVKPTVRVYNGNKQLLEGRDYTIRFKNNVKVSDTASIVVKGKGNYSGTETKTFQITPVDLNDSRIETDDIMVAYNQKVQKPVPVVTFNGKKLKKNKDFIISYLSVEKGISGANKEIGDYEIEIRAKQGGNFTGSRVIQLTVSDKILISKAKVGKIANQPYNNGAEVKPPVTVTMKSDILTEGQHYTVEYQNNTEIGTATAVLTGIGEYAGTKKITFKITGKSIIKASVSGLDSIVYDGTEQKPKLTVTLNGASLTEGINYNVQYTNNTRAGKATVTITGINDCTGTVKKIFKIQPFDLQADAQSNAENRQVNGLEADVTVKYVKGGAKPVPVLTYKNTVLKAGTDYTISYKNNKKPATQNDTKAPSFTIKGKGNFSGTVSKTFTIESKTLNDPESPVTISVPDLGYVDKAGKYVSKPVLMDTDGTKLVSGRDYNNIVYSRQSESGETLLTKTDKAEVGSVIHVKVSGAGVYAGGELEASYRITPSDFSKAKITIKPQEYTGEAVILTKEAIQSVKAGGTDITSQYGTSYEIVEGSYKNNVKKGTASVTLRGKGNYGGTKTVKFKITTKKFGGFKWFWK